MPPRTIRTAQQWLPHDVWTAMEITETQQCALGTPQSQIPARFARVTGLDEGVDVASQQLGVQRCATVRTAPTTTTGRKKHKGNSGAPIPVTGGSGSNNAVNLYYYCLYCCASSMPICRNWVQQTVRVPSARSIALAKGGGSLIQPLHTLLTGVPHMMQYATKKFQQKRGNTRKHPGRRSVGSLNKEEETGGHPEVPDGPQDGTEVWPSTQGMEPGGQMAEGRER
ncbi:hypothetical protein B0H14DRAFT_2627199 [Mycena olivaceomarginata]|nr:hypothetical protein B0H14DRAFT_2627199 [Mycena olivaceomarginata]